MSSSPRIREIPYNYTSFSDREIVIRFLGEEAWEILSQLRGQRKTGRSARMMFEALGDMWVIRRNPYIQDDLIGNAKRRQSLVHALRFRLQQVLERANNNQLTLALVESAENAVDQFEQWLNRQAPLRQRTFRKLARVTAKDNIHFDGLARVSHATDASDWRVEFPFIVITPDTEQEVRGIVEACIELGLTMIPRGGGTGYTGSAVPLEADTAVINLERLEKISEIERINLPGGGGGVASIRAEAGVVTQRVTDVAESSGLAFAVDPTSQNASTIGGNIAMNAGGKKAVRWGTALDNLISWKMVTPDAEWILIERLNHNRGKLHDAPYAEFRVQPLERDGKQFKGKPNVLKIPTEKMRRPGLGKDVTRKFLEGLPGAQKEGCDGLITSARFMLHRQSSVLQTVCLEFFGSDLHHAVPAIVETIDLLKQTDGVALIGLEHLDERYIKAVKYTTKAARPTLPRMVLLADIGGENEENVSEAAKAVVAIAQSRDGEGFIAESPESRRKFWAERARTAAIAAHTNAFKINEDVVIPLERLADYAEGIERINIEQSIQNKLDGIDQLLGFLSKQLRQISERLEAEEGEEYHKIVVDKEQLAADHLKQVQTRWSLFLEKMDEPASRHQHLLDFDPGADTLFQILQRRELRVSWKEEIEKPLRELFSGRNLEEIRHKINEFHSSVKARRLFVATHMHAGDGNVHTNIPVHSNDYGMLQEAERVVDRIMELACSLGGVISGEHGIGLTKIGYLDDAEIDAFAQYKQAVDPKGHFNRGKLMRDSGLENAYTPSLQLVQQEALILEANDLRNMNQSIKDCLRCGKCKPVCTTHVPAANLLYSPRNKILATGLMIEAVLYEEQTRRGISFRHFTEMNNIADHCTICHRCEAKCPVNIDFGKVTMQMRTVLKKLGKRKSSPAHWMSMRFLNATNPGSIRLMRMGLVQFSYRMQRLAHQWTRSLLKFRARPRPTATTEPPKLQEQLVHFLRHPMPGEKIGGKMPRAILGLEDPRYVPILRNPKTTTDDSEAVFFFPGCGAERLFGQVELAVLNMLYALDVQTILPPGYLCCGYPQRAAGQEKQGHQISMGNRVLFHRIANTLNYLDIRTVLVSCGTCMDQLMQYEFQQIFPDCKLMDIHEYLRAKGVTLETDDAGKKNNAGNYLYHDPCHTPMKATNAVRTVSTLMGQDVLLSDRCCGESGTFAVSRPDIATQVKFRKERELKTGIQSLIGKEQVGLRDKVKILTSCPSCQQGLMRYEESTGLGVDYVVVELARRLHGEKWQQKFLKKIKADDGIEQVLL